MLVLSLFPGIGLLDRAFEEEGFTVVRGPDKLWGGDVRRFHVPAGRFDGVIGGPPCQVHSSMAALNPHAGEADGDLIPEYVRVVEEARPAWFVMENVPEATEPQPRQYHVKHLVLNNRWIGDGVGQEQNRERRFSFGCLCCKRCCPGGPAFDVGPDLALFENPVWRHAVLAGHGDTKSQRFSGRGFGLYEPADMAELQGLPRDFAERLPFTVHGKRKVIGNGVPLPMGRAIARAVKRALESETAA